MMEYNLDKSYSEFLREVMYENDSFLEKEKKEAKTAEIRENMTI